MHGLVRRSSTERFDASSTCAPITLHQRRPARPALAASTRSPRRARTRSTTSPALSLGRRVVGASPTLTAEVSGVGRRAPARRAARQLPARALLAGVLERDLRAGGRRRPGRGRRRRRPRSPYGAAKALRPPRHWCRPTASAYGLHCCSSAILFDHESPRRPLRVRDPQDRLARRGDQARAASASCASATSTPVRDWGFAGDYVDAMWRMLQRDEPSDVVLPPASGPTSIERLRARSPSRTSVSTGASTYVRVDDAFERPADSRPSRSATRRRPPASSAGRPASSFDALVAS